MIKIRERIDMSVRYEVLRGNAVYSRIYAYGTPTISMSASSELKTSISGNFYSYRDKNINFLTDKLRVIVTINGIYYMAGTYVITTEIDEKKEGIDIIQVEGYSLLYLTKRKKIEERLFFSSGTRYTNALAQLLIGAGITSYNIDTSTLAFPTDREDWEIGTSHLTIINKLLEEMSYNTAWVDNSGVIKLTKYAVPSYANVKHTYKNDEYSVLGADHTRANDYHDKANVFKVICSNPDFPTPLIATSENNESGSPYSISKVGRILHVETIDNIANQSALQAKADELKNKSLLSTEEVTFSTIINPEHNVFDTVVLSNSDLLSGIYTETEWEMTLSPGSMMNHVARRALYD